MSIGNDEVPPRTPVTYAIAGDAVPKRTNTRGMNGLKNYSERLLRASFLLLLRSGGFETGLNNILKPLGGPNKLFHWMGVQMMCVGPSRVNSFTAEIILRYAVYSERVCWLMESKTCNSDAKFLKVKAALDAEYVIMKAFARVEFFMITKNLPFFGISDIYFSKEIYI